MPRLERTNKPLRFLLALCLAFASVGCGGDDGAEATAGANNGASNDAGSTDGPGEGGGDVDNTGVAYAERYQQRFTSLRFDQGTAAAGLNGILKSNFDQSLEYPIIVLLDLQGIDAEAGTLKVRGGSGLKGSAEGEYTWHPDAAETLYDGTLEAESGALHFEVDRFEFIATFVLEDDVREVVLPIQDLSFDGNVKLNEDGSEAEIVGGRLAGYLTKEDGDETGVVLVPGSEPVYLTELFGADRLNYDTSTGMIVEAGQGDAWFLTASFETTPTTIVD